MGSEMCIRDSIFSCAQIWSGVWPNSNARRLTHPKDWLVGPPPDQKSLNVSTNLRTCQKSGTIIPAKFIGLLFPERFLLFPESFLPFQKASCLSRKLPAFPESSLPFQKEQSFIIAHNRKGPRVPKGPKGVQDTKINKGQGSQKGPKGSKIRKSIRAKGPKRAQRGPRYEN